MTTFNNMDDAWNRQYFFKLVHEKINILNILCLINDISSVDTG